MGSKLSSSGVTEVQHKLLDLTSNLTKAPGFGMLLAFIL